MTLRILTGVATALVAASAPGQTAISLGTATPGGGFPVYGAAFTEVVNANEPTLRIEPRNTKGSTENVPLLEAGNLDIALVQGEVANPALAKTDTPLRIVTAMYSSPGMFVVRGDSPYRTIAELRGKPVALGAQGSGLTILGRNVLGAVGIDPDRDIQAIYLERAADGPAMVLDGRAAALWGAGVGWPGSPPSRGRRALRAPDAEKWNASSRSIRSSGHHDAGRRYPGRIRPSRPSARGLRARAARTVGRHGVPYRASPP
jgi:TRAP transporter TAXI family solute receptor